MIDDRIKRAIRLYDRGDCRNAMALLLGYIDTYPPDEDPGDRQWAQLYLVEMYRNRGERQIGLRLLQSLEKEPEPGPCFRANLFIELSRTHRDLGDLAASRSCLRQAERLIDFSVPGETDRGQYYLLAHYNASCGRHFQQAGNQHRAIEHFMLARIPAAAIEHNMTITLYLNLANSHAVLGQRDEARDFLTLAFAALKSLDVPYAHGLIHYFQTLAAFNLLIYDSKVKTIECLSKISEKMIENFDDLKRVFDFFSEVLVQQHEGKFDIDKLKQIKDYHDDALIRAYLPALIAGAPRPDEEVGKDEENE